MSPTAMVDVSAIPELISLYKGALQFAANKEPSFTLRYTKTGIIEKDEENLLNMIEELLENMERILIHK